MASRRTSATDTRAFGRRLRQIRKAAGLPLEALEWQTGLSRQFIHDLERGNRNASPDTVEALAKAMLVTAAALRGEEVPQIIDLSKHWKAARKKAMALAWERVAMAGGSNTEAERLTRKWMLGMSRKFAEEAERLDSEAQ